MSTVTTTKTKTKSKLQGKDLALAHWQTVKNKAKSYFSFGKVKTTHALYDLVGALELKASRANEPLNRLTLNAILNELEQRITLKESTSIAPLEQETKTDSKDQSESFLRLSNYMSETVYLDGDRQVSDKKENAVVKHNEKSDADDEQELIDTYYKADDYKQDGKQKAKLWKKQKLAVARILKAFEQDHKLGILLLAQVGAGKTFIFGAVIRRLFDNGFFDDCVSPWPCCVVTKASIVEQTKRVLKRQFGIDTVNDCQVINIDSLRATFGERFIRWVDIVDQGDAISKPEWKNNIHPKLIIWDECQTLKNESSLQSQIGQAFNDINARPNYKFKVYQLFSSATPFTRVCEAKCFAVATRVPYDYGVSKGMPLSNEIWSDFKAHIASPAKPEEHSPAAVERLTNYLLDYIVDVKGLRPQFHARNSVQMIDFQTKEEYDFYHSAWERYQKEKLRIEGTEGMSAGASRFQILAQFTKFRQAAELCRAKYIAEFMYLSVTRDNKAAVAAINFKGTGAKVAQYLIEDYGVSRDQISMIWGGVSKKQKVKKKKSDLMDDEQTENYRSTLEDLGMTDEEIEEMMNMEETVEEETNNSIPPEYRFGAQSLAQRQTEIDNFQSGKTLYCIFTFKSGGVGLSLHHTDEFTTFKARKQDNGWANKEDIAQVPTRPRRAILTPTYSAIELVQGLGRAPRLTSLSDTEQLLVFYRGTIEERVAITVSLKLKCLKKVVRQRESWEDVIVGSKPEPTKEEREELAKLLPADVASETVVTNDLTDKADATSPIKLMERLKQSNTTVIDVEDISELEQEDK